MPVTAPIPPPALPDDVQQRLIAIELDLDEDPKFLAYLQGIWGLYYGFGQVNSMLRWLYVRRHAIQFLMGRAKHLRTFKFADTSRNDSDVMKGLKVMLDATQAEIDDLIGKAVNRTASADIIAAGGNIQLPQNGPMLFLGGSGLGTGPVTNNAAGKTVTAAAAAVTNKAPVIPSPSAPVLAAEPLPQLTDWSGVILDGGFSQQAIPENPLRTYLLLKNTGQQPLWWERGQDAIMGESALLAKGKTVELKGAGVPTVFITIVGAAANAPYQALSD